MAAQNDLVAPLGEVIAIPVDEIELGERLRPVDTAWAAALGHIMLRDGQLTPIEVCKLPGRKTYTLVKGGHRLTAGQVYPELSPIKAIVVSADAAERRMRELSDDFFRRDLMPVDRAAFIAELVTLQKLRDGVDPAKDGRAASANVRWQKAIQQEADDATATIAVAYGWTEKVSEQIGISPRTVRDNLALYPLPVTERWLAGLGRKGQAAAMQAANTIVQPDLVRHLWVEGKDGSLLLVRRFIRKLPRGWSTVDVHSDFWRFGVVRQLGGGVTIWQRSAD
jgi:hypothetical protein